MRTRHLLDTDAAMILEFTIGEDGVITEAFYVDADGNHILYDKDGYQTGIIVKANGTYEKDGEQVTVAQNGNAVKGRYTLELRA